MNILIPDVWLREYLKTKATPLQIKEYLSLCGPSVEQINTVGKEVIYDIEVTSNRPDAMSIVGIAREATAILPRFGIAAKLVGDPYLTFKGIKGKSEPSKALRLAVKTDATLNPRWTSVIFKNAKVAPSPRWLSEWLELSGIRSLNNVIDITNFLMHAYGQPAHVFDYDAIVAHTMILRASKKGEKLTTLDGKSHTLPGDDIVIADGSGKLIDLCGIMGAKSSSITEKTTRVVLFLQTYDPTHIRRTSMALAHRTEAAGLFEKDLDPELVMPVFLKGIEMMGELTGAKIASAVTDIYPAPYKAPTVSVKRSKVASYIGEISDKEIKEILVSLGLATTFPKDTISVKIPGFRRDVAIDVDIIEELARIYGFHNIPSLLPSGEPPVVLPDPTLSWEEEVKIRLRDWGYTELYTYSMISEEQMDWLELDKQKAYKIANPLSGDWVYMRPTLWPTMLSVVRANLNLRDKLKLFELSLKYKWGEGNLPNEQPIFLVAWAGDKFSEAKGLAEALFDLFGIPFPDPDGDQPLDWYDPVRRLAIGKYGSVGIVNQSLQNKFGLTKQVTILDLDFRLLVANANPSRSFQPIPKYPPIIEDLAFVVPERFTIGPLIEALKTAHPLVSDVTLLDVHQNTRTLHISYQDPNRNLTSEDIQPVRVKLIKLATEAFSLQLKNSS